MQTKPNGNLSNRRTSRFSEKLFRKILKARTSQYMETTTSNVNDHPVVGPQGPNFAKLSAGRKMTSGENIRPDAFRNSLDLESINAELITSLAVARDEQETSFPKRIAVVNKKSDAKRRKW